MQLRSAVVAAVTLVLLLPVGAASAAGSTCAAATPAQFGPEFLRLQRDLGDVMGVPTTCEQPAGDGDLVQATSTGVAIYRAQIATALFVRGEEHWALAGDELVSWTGSWHEGLDPPPAPAPTDGNPVDLGPPQPSAAVASILVVTLVGAAHNQPTVLLLDSEGSTYRVQVGDGCQDAIRELGQPVYVRSVGPLGSPGSDLVLLPEREACPILAMLPG